MFDLAERNEPIMYLKNHPATIIDALVDLVEACYQDGVRDSGGPSLEFALSNASKILKEEGRDIGMVN